MVLLLLLLLLVLLLLLLLLFLLRLLLILRRSSIVLAGKLTIRLVWIHLIGTVAVESGFGMNGMNAVGMTRTQHCGSGRRKASLSGVPHVLPLLTA